MVPWDQVVGTGPGSSPGLPGNGNHHSDSLQSRGNSERVGRSMSMLGTLGKLVVSTKITNLKEMIPRNIPSVI